MRIRNGYYQCGMLFFYKNIFGKAITTLVFDINDLIWKKKGQNAIVPAWKMIYVFTPHDYKINKRKIVYLMNSSMLGKILKCEIQGKKVYMLVLYKIGLESFISKQFTYFELESTYHDIALGFSKRIYANCYISQGEGYHREECEEEDLKKYFRGNNFYKYNFRRRGIHD